MIKLKNYIAAAIAATAFGAFAQAYAAPVLSVAATPNPAVLGSNVDVNVMISDIADLYAYQFTLTFDAARFKAVGVTEGAFLGTAGATFGDAGTIDNAAGTISFVFNTLLGPVPGAFGSGSLANITFKALSAGTSSLTFSDLLFLDSAEADIAVGVEPAAIQAVPEPASYLLFGVGLVAVGLLRRRQLAPLG